MSEGREISDRRVTMVEAGHWAGLVRSHWEALGRNPTDAEADQMLATARQMAREDALAAAAANRGAK